MTFHNMNFKSLIDNKQNLILFWIQIYQRVTQNCSKRFKIIQNKDIKARIAMVMRRCGQLSHIFNSPNIGSRIKIHLYVVTVCSLLSYGCETWDLTPKVRSLINGANSRMLARITGNEVRVEARAATTSHDIVAHMRRMRMRWLGRILRGNQDNLTFKAIMAQIHMGGLGNLLMDAPPFVDLQDLVVKATDKALWTEFENTII